MTSSSIVNIPAEIPSIREPEQPNATIEFVVFLHTKGYTEFILMIIDVKKPHRGFVVVEFVVIICRYEIVCHIMNP